MSDLSAQTQNIVLSFPDPVARQMEMLATQEQRQVSDVLQDGFRLYRLRKLDAQLEAFRAGLPETEHTEQDVEAFVDEARKLRSTAGA